MNGQTAILVFGFIALIVSFVATVGDKYIEMEGTRIGDVGGLWIGDPDRTSIADFFHGHSYIANELSESTREALQLLMAMCRGLSVITFVIPVLVIVGWHDTSDKTFVFGSLGFGLFALQAVLFITVRHQANTTKHILCSDPIAPRASWCPSSANPGLSYILSLVSSMFSLVACVMLLRFHRQKKSVAPKHMQ